MEPVPVSSRWNRAWRLASFAAGFALAAGLLTSLAEGYARYFPPVDLYPYLGDDSPAQGIYKSDPDFRVTYKSWDAFHDDNAPRLNLYLPFDKFAPGPKLWAMFGNSFIQAPGMLADHARVLVPDRCVFNLARNENLLVRLAQIKLLLEAGLQPERIFIELMPVDLAILGEEPLSMVQVNARGALGYTPHVPGGPLGSVVRNSRLAFTAWTRTGRHKGNREFDRRTLYQGLHPQLYTDVAELFGNLSQLVQSRGVPVTILLIPSFDQVVGNASFNFQDQLAGLFRAQGYDVIDPRSPFRKHDDPASLYIPDKHLSNAGNILLTNQILDHLRGVQVASTSGGGAP
ncbi:hypothetical protein BH10PLA2_BH10PLA2_05770 [soil metagenome]